jgi:serine/threonine protein kinase
VLLFAMICGTVPFKAQSMHELHDLIINGRFDFPNSISSQLSCEVKDLVCRMLIVNPKERISISEILKHPWIQLFDSILDDNQEYQMDGDITLHSFDAQNALQH